MLLGRRFVKLMEGKSLAEVSCYMGALCMGTLEQIALAVKVDVRKYLTDHLDACKATMDNKLSNDDK